MVQNLYINKCELIYQVLFFFLCLWIWDTGKSRNKRSWKSWANVWVTIYWLSTWSFQVESVFYHKKQNNGIYIPVQNDGDVAVSEGTPLSSSNTSYHSLPQLCWPIHVFLTFLIFYFLVPGIEPMGLTCANHVLYHWVTSLALLNISQLHSSHW